MDGIRKVPVLFTKLRISSHCERKMIINTCHNNSKLALSEPATLVVSKNSSESSKDLSENPKFPSLMDITSKLGIRFDNLISCLKISPELINESPIVWENCFKEVTAYGFSKKKFMRMVTMYPPLFKIVKDEELKPAMENWMNCKLGYDNMLDLLATQPQYLSIPKSELNKRIPLLMSITRSSGKNVVRLLRGCPSLMYQDWRDVNGKINYIENIMRIDMKKENLSRCYAMNRTLDEIQTRHMFLERAGIYIRRPFIVKGTKLQQEQQPWSKNPCLADIMDTSDKVFISKVAKGLSLEELEVFREIYKIELDEQSESDTDDD